MQEVTKNTTNAVVSGVGVGGTTVNSYLPSADVSISKSAPATVASNGTIRWSIKVANNGPADSHGFIVNDAVPANVMKPAIVSAPSGCQLSGRNLRCSAAPPGCSGSANSTVPSWVDLACANSAQAGTTVLPAGSAFGPIVLSGVAPFAAGSVITNSATVFGTDSDPNLQNNDASVSTTVRAAPSLSLAKTADDSGVRNPARLGDVINYHFRSMNTGNTTLTQVQIIDRLPGLSALQYSWPGMPGTLLPGQSVTATASYRPTQLDIDAGHVRNTASGSANPPSGPAVIPTPSSTDTLLMAAPGISLTKTADASGVEIPARVGDVIRYHFRSQNTGNLTLTEVKITDNLPGLSALTYSWPGPVGRLLPGQEVTAMASYRVTQADIDAGHVQNTGTTVALIPPEKPISSLPSTVDTWFIDPAEAYLANTGAELGMSAWAIGFFGCGLALRLVSRRRKPTQTKSIST
nr:DUF11 domain-containing protein [Psychromicrobium silvestre]